MNLVFFDIECACVYKTTAKICAFGYVVCDANFNILKREDILINPKGKFHLTDRKGDRGLVLPYRYADFKNYPPFTEVYPYIKSLLEDKNNIVLGHSTMNDVKYLKLETKRFSLPSFKFSFSDSQLIYETYKGDFTRQLGLEYIANALGVEFTPHRAVDDAYATMRIVEAICKATGCSYTQLVKDLGVSEGRIKNYMITPPSSKGEREYHEKLAKEKEVRTKNRIKFFNHVNRKKIVKGGKYYGKTFSFSRLIEDDTETAKALVDKIYANGGKYSHHVNLSDYYVADEGDATPRTQDAKKAANITVITLKDLETMLK